MFQEGCSIYQLDPVTAGSNHSTSFSECLWAHMHECLGGTNEMHEREARDKAAAMICVCVFAGKYEVPRFCFESGLLLCRPPNTTFLLLFL